MEEIESSIVVKWTNSTEIKERVKGSRVDIRVVTLIYVKLNNIVINSDTSVYYIKDVYVYTMDIYLSLS